MTDRNIVVLITSTMLGEPEPQLGTLLMRSLLKTMKDPGPMPRTILFLHGGARLTVEGSDLLEDIKAMAAAGVTIKTCGTCLDYYGLRDKLAVGEVGTMGDTVATLAQADLVIRP